METIRSADGTPIAFARTGAGPPLILVHGTSSDHTRWDSVAPVLGEQFTVYALDRRGRGGSGDAVTYALDREVEDILAVRTAIAGPVALLGHSYGGICALEAALRMPQLRRLVLYEPPIAVGATAPTDDLVDRIEQLVAAGDHDGAVTLFMREGVRRPEAEIAQLRQTPEWDRRVMAAHTIPREGRAVAGYVLAPARLGTLTVPTLLLLGGASPAPVRATMEALAAALPQSRLAVLAGQGHGAMATAPDQFVSAVLPFLTDPN